MEFAIIGGGNMGRALASALIGRGVSGGDTILVVDPDEATRERNAMLGCTVSPTPDERISEASVVVVAVKPQQAEAAYGQLKPFLGPAQVVVSIMAGIPVKQLQAGLGHEAVVRVMPNTPAQVGLGMNVYYAVPSVPSAQLKRVEALLNASGESLAVKSEDAIDAATAISGSGPAYLFYVAEHWMRAAMQLGFREEEAEQLVQQTVVGATALWREQNVSVSDLRAAVTSKGGTTAAALDYFDEHHLGDHLTEGIHRAFRRARELGGH